MKKNKILNAFKKYEISKNDSQLIFGGTRCTGWTQDGNNTTFDYEDNGHQYCNSWDYGAHPEIGDEWLVIPNGNGGNNPTKTNQLSQFSANFGIVQSVKMEINTIKF